MNLKYLKTSFYTYFHDIVNVNIMIMSKWINKKRRASPFIEEGILIVFGLFIFLIILGSINQILDWFVSFSEKMFSDLKSNIPFLGILLKLAK